MLSVLVRVRGDSAHAEATLIDVARGRPARRPVQPSAALTDLAGLVRPIVAEVLGLGAGDANPAAMRRLSAFPDAIVAYFEGTQALESGRLSEAESSLRRALAVDSTFALARHHLALSLYLGARGIGRRELMAAPEVAQLSTFAAAHSSGLALRDSLRIAAFHAFQSGDFERARSTYATILADDPTDVFALLMRGTVELRDQWLVGLSDSAYRPRSNPNVAIRDLNEILRLRPTFDLGYYHLSEIQRRIDDAAGDRTQCPGFELPRDQVRPPETAVTPEQQRSYCPVIVGDTIAWIARNDLETFGKARARTGAAQFFERYIALVRRWATYAPNEIRPQEEMVTALLAQRRRLGVAAPHRHTAYADSARRFAEGALALKPDTTPDDLAQLGNIYLAIGDYARARRTTEIGLQKARSQDPAPRILAANPFLATGQPSRAMEIRSAVPLQRFTSDPASGELIPFGGVELPLWRIQILGATGVGGAALQQELRDVFRLWSESRYTDYQRRLLRANVTMELATAFSLEPEVLLSWDRTVTINNPLWRSLVMSLSDSAQARRLLLASFDSTGGPLSEATRSYLQGVVAGKIGDHRLAIARYSRIDSLPLATDALDLGWGVRSLSELRRAESYEALGDTALARRHYQTFLTLWASPDALARQQGQQAAGRAARLGKPS
jgi:tetratricopeptide (TPR) repeat protein